MCPLKTGFFLTPPPKNTKSAFTMQGPKEFFFARMYYYIPEKGEKLPLHPLRKKQNSCFHKGEIIKNFVELLFSAFLIF
jgi:hypothetical protein